MDVHSTSELTGTRRYITWISRLCTPSSTRPVDIRWDILRLSRGDLSTYFGLAKVKISPPRGLFHPILGYRTGGKLTFPLCRACVERQQQEPCACNENERAWIGTYCTPELKKALEKGYKINKIYEVYHWQSSAQYDPESQTGGLFASYINLFLKIKQEASGRPAWVQTDADLD